MISCILLKDVYVSGNIRKPWKILFASWWSLWAFTMMLFFLLWEEMELISSCSWHHMTLQQGQYKALRNPTKEQIYKSCKTAFERQMEESKGDYFQNSNFSSRSPKNDASCYFVTCLLGSREGLAFNALLEKKKYICSEIITVSHLDYKWVVRTTSPLEAFDRHCQLWATVAFCP